MLDKNRHEFNQQRSRFSDWIVQYGMVFFLLLCTVTVGAVWVLNDRYDQRLQMLDEFHAAAYSVLELQHDWLTMSDLSESSMAELLLKEQHIGEHIQTLHAQGFALPTPPATADGFSMADQSKLAINRLQQIKQLIELQIRQNMARPLIDGVGLSFVLMASLSMMIYLVWGWRRILHDRKSALAYFHSQLDKAQNGTLEHSVPLGRQDEFGDFARYLESVLLAMLKDLDQQTNMVGMYRHALSSSLSFKLVVNTKYEIVSVSDGLSSLWVTDSVALADLLGVDEHLATLEGEIISDEIINNSQETIRIGRKLYSIQVIDLEGIDSSSGCLIELVAKEVHHELKVLESVLSLMTNDVWDAPIRILDETSPYYSFSKKLETLRQNVVVFLADFSAKSAEIDKEYPKVTKLQQLLEQLVARLKASELIATDHADYEKRIISDVDASRQQFLRVREQIEHRFELYEAYLQQLVAWQASQRTWVETVNTGLMDTKQAVLNLLSLVHSDHTSASVIEHSVIDLVHDLDTVLESIVETKPVENQLGLEHIKSSESDLMRRLNDVQNTLARLSDFANDQSTSHHS